MKNYNRDAVELRKRSAAAGRKWAIFGDEQPPDSVGVMPDANDPEHNEPRTQALWGNLMGGGSGVEWYFGYKFPNMDINCEDFRSRDKMWDQTRYALEFFQKYVPFEEMEPDNSRVSGVASGWALAKADDVILVYLPEGGATAQVRLGAGAYTVSWYNPRAGGPLVKGAALQGPGVKAIGPPPLDAAGDWAALIRKR